MGSHYGLQQNLTELGTDITPTSMSQLRKLLNNIKIKGVPH